MTQDVFVLGEARSTVHVEYFDDYSLYVFEAILDPDGLGEGGAQGVGDHLCLTDLLIHGAGYWVYMCTGKHRYTHGARYWVYMCTGKHESKRGRGTGCED